MKTETQKLNVTAAGWESIAASYEPKTDTVLVEAKATNGDTAMVRWTRDGSGDICDDRYTDWATFDQLTDALFAAVWSAAPGPEREGFTSLYNPDGSLSLKALHLDGTLPKGCGAWDVTSYPFGGDFIRPSINIHVTNIRPSAKEGWMLADCEGYPNRKGKRVICSNKFSLF